MPQKLPPLTALRTFEVAARTGSFTAAASELGVTHGAVSKQIQSLEEWLGQTLFTRAGQRMAPTLHGRAFAREISEAFDRIADAARRYGNVSATQVLRVNAPASFTMRWLIPRLPQFYESHPDTEVRISTSSALDETLRGSFDLLIRHGPQPWEQYSAKEFLDEFNTLVASPRLLKRQPLRRLEDLSKHTILSTESRPGDWENWLLAAGYNGSPPARQERYDHYFVVLLATLDGLGVSIGPMPVLANDVRAGRLRTPFSRITVQRPSYFVLTPLDADKSPMMHAFVNWLIRAGADSRLPVAPSANGSKG
jgi:LysR family transcriptional regulator, glycine cleavage system transcriptional activator